jgi:hypothetical protein
VFTVNIWSLLSHGELGGTMDLLRNTFPGHFISGLDNIPWTPRSPNLSAPNIFLSRQTFQTRPQSIQEIKNRIINRNPNFLVAECNEQFLLKIATNSETHCRTFDWYHF